MTKHYQSILAVTALIVAMGIVGQSDYEEEQQQVKQYCEMVNLWKQSGGQSGWPAYDGEEMCRTSNVLEGIAERDTTPTKEHKE